LLDDYHIFLYFQFDSIKDNYQFYLLFLFREYSYQMKVHLVKLVKDSCLQMDDYIDMCGKLNLKYYLLNFPTSITGESA
jgi:hypothetical protein